MFDKFNTIHCLETEPRLASFEDFGSGVAEVSVQGAFEDEATALPPNVGNRLPSDAVAYPRRTESKASIMYVLFYYCCDLQPFVNTTFC